MNEATQAVLMVALIAAVPPTMAAVAALIASIQSKRKAEETLEQGRQIHVLVNSNLDQVKAELISTRSELVAANSQISILLKHLQTSRPATEEEIA